MWFSTRYSFPWWKHDSSQPVWFPTHWVGYCPNAYKDVRALMLLCTKHPGSYYMRRYVYTSVATKLCIFGNIQGFCTGIWLGMTHKAWKFYVNVQRSAGHSGDDVEIFLLGLFAARFCCLVHGLSSLLSAVFGFLSCLSWHDSLPVGKGHVTVCVSEHFVCLYVTSPINSETSINAPFVNTSPTICVCI